MVFSEEVTKEVCTIEYISEKINAEATLVEVTNKHKGRSSVKKTVKKGDIVRTGRGGVNPSSFFKPKFTGFSNHSEMDF